MPFRAPGRTLTVVVALLLVLAGTPMTTGAPRPAPAAPLLDLDLYVTPSTILMVPLVGQNMRLSFTGHVLVSKQRPGTVVVNLQCTVDTDWSAWTEPSALYFSHVGEQTQTFQGYTTVPPNTFGPPEVRMSVRAWTNLTGRSVEDSTVVVITIISNAQAYMENLASLFTVQRPNMDLYGKVTVNNMGTRPLEFHLGALGAWRERIPDLDFDHPLVLGPSETKNVAFHGTLPSDLEPGEYTVPIGLWTPGEGGERTYITSHNVTVQLLRRYETESDSIQYLALLVTVLVACPIAALMFIYIYMIRDRWFWGREPSVRAS